MKINDFFDKTIFFYCVQPTSVDNAAYHHLAICIAEGLKKLGIKFYSNINYWRLSPNQEEYLFNHDPHVTPNDCSVVVLSLPWLFQTESLPPELFNKSRKYRTVYLDRQDGLKTFSWRSEFRQFDFILKTHYCFNHRYPSNFHPWAFGFSERMIEEASRAAANHSERVDKILVNFRNKRNAHTVRKKFYHDILPELRELFLIDDQIDQLREPPDDDRQKLLWYQTGKRHYPQYYDRLSYSKACACFGGYFVGPWPRGKGNYLSKLQERLISALGFMTQDIVQWDSWRLWESFLSGCVTFHVDFELYNFQLPVMPENWRHYVGVDFRYPKQVVEKLSNNYELLELIASQGQSWAIENYSPVATAERFIELTCS